MAKKKIAIGIGIYLLIGIVIWQWGYIEAPSLKEGIFTFLYIVLLWPVVVLLKLIAG